MRFALYLLLLEKEKRKEQRTPFKTLLDDDRKRRRDHRIPRAALQSPKESSFVTLFESGDDQALITLTGFDHATFQELHNLFAPVFNTFTLSLGVQHKESGGHGTYSHHHPALS